jgi:hypothetical protein
MQLAAQEQGFAIAAEASAAQGVAATTGDADVAMHVDEPSQQQRASGKRKAEEEPESDPHKKAKIGMYKLHSVLYLHLNFLLHFRTEASSQEVGLYLCHWTRIL